MATDNIVNELIVNTLTQAQFDAIPESERSDTELYFITDAEGDTGGSNEIKWTHVYDIPDDDRWYSYLYLSFKVDTLPDGNYEFYFYTTRNYSDRNLLVPTTWKVSFFVKTDEYRQVQGFISPIFNGDFSFLFESFSIYSQGIKYHHTSDGDILVPETFYACKANTSSIIKGIAKCTDIINVDTNQVYPTTLTLDSDVPFFDNQIGYIDLGIMVEYPKQSNTEHNSFTFNNDGLCLYGIGKDPESFGDGYGSLGGVITVKSIADSGEFEAEVYVNEGGVTYKVIKASGILQNAELGTSSTQSANTWLKPNFEDGQSHECEFWYSRFGANDNTNFYWFNPGAEDVYVPYTKLNVGSTVTPLNYNKVIQYIQESTDEYTQGYFYKAVGDIIDIPENIALTKTLESDFEISLVDDKDIISALSLVIGWSIEATIENLKYSQFRYYYGAGNPYVWWNHWGDIYNQEVLSCFNVIPESEAPEGYPSYVEFTLQYAPASQKVENGRWEQVNVQPASGIEDSMGSANALIDTHNTSLNAHENIRGIANGLATLDDNAKVPMSQINDSLLGNVQYQGLYNVSTNTPNLDTVETKGHYYIVSVAGDRFDISFEIGDWIISDGTNWTKVDNTDAVSSVNGRTGNVVITTEDLDLSAYVQKTDYASSKAAGLIRGYNANGFGFVPDTGYPFCEAKSLANYNVAGGNLFIGKGTLESIKYSYVRDGIANNTYSLSNTEKEKVRNWIGAGVPTTFETMPDIYASAGKTYQYVGETTEEFTSGYFYKSVSQGISYIPSDSNLTFDFDLFWSELESAGITLETLQMTEMDKERGGFSIIGAVESETNYRVQDINGVQLDVLLTQSIQATSEYVGANNRWYYKPSETFAWERVDTQPNTNMNIPAHPTTPGSYMLMCTVGEDGTVSYSWETVA